MCEFASSYYSGKYSTPITRDVNELSWFPKVEKPEIPHNLTPYKPKDMIDDKELEIVDQMKLLGVIINSELTWKENANYIIKVRSILEFTVPVWSGSLTKEEKYQNPFVLSYQEKIIINTILH